jgi:hypothetical protein
MSSCSVTTPLAASGLKASSTSRRDSSSSITTWAGEGRRGKEGRGRVRACVGGGTLAAPSPCQAEFSVLMPGRDTEARAIALPLIPLPLTLRAYSSLPPTCSQARFISGSSITCSGASSGEGVDCSGGQRGGCVDEMEHTQHTHTHTCARSSRNPALSLAGLAAP